MDRRASVCLPQFGRSEVGNFFVAFVALAVQSCSCSAVPPFRIRSEGRKVFRNEGFATRDVGCIKRLSQSHVVPETERADS